MSEAVLAYTHLKHNLNLIGHLTISDIVQNMTF